MTYFIDNQFYHNINDVKLEFDMISDFEEISYPAVTFMDSVLQSLEISKIDFLNSLGKITSHKQMERGFCKILETIPLNTCCFRYAVYHDVNNFKKSRMLSNGMYECEITGDIVSKDEINVDHCGLMFNDIKNAFKFKYGENFRIKKDDYNNTCFEDWKYTKKFREYHAELATYRLIRRSINHNDGLKEQEKKEDLKERLKRLELI
ncbi:hypothetical protein JK182_01525 [Acetobacter okinawensis]|uniref:hypothetical protein n=1 Tax=Acetobacter okinawensis TaxID=1076594 RepID=UPI001BA596AD|nr:hypothetical protein [Acetobacter okinawensis]MBS0987372.1 hypothetical protein [Acetobacter okinawensis]